MIAAGLAVLVLLLAALLVRQHRRAARGALAEVLLQAALGAQVAKMDAVVAGMPDGLLVIDAGLQVVQWNEQFPGITGVPAEMLRPGLSLAEVLRAQAQAGEFGPVDVDAEVARRMVLVQSGVATGTIERTRPNGRILELRRSPMAGGGFVTLYSDITDRREVENQLRQAQKMEAIGQLTGGVAHDFNNLLMVILGNLELAERALGRSDLLGAAQKIEVAGGGARRAAVLTQRLLAFARKQRLEPQAFDVNAAISGMSELIRHSIGQAIELETVLAGGMWEALVDSNQLENALLNLAINARDAMPEGGKLTIETSNSYLDAAYAAGNPEVTPGQYVLIAVSDGGTGMTAEEVDQAFEPFFTTKDIGEGSGLGLSQVFGFIKQSQGHVKIYSELGVGTTVKLYLPRHRGAEPAVEEADAGPAEPARARAGECVLVVEDNPDVLEFSVDALESLGYRVIGAANAAAGLAAIDRHPEIGLLFTDVELPGMNGQQLVEEVKRRRPEIGTLYTTGFTVNALVHRDVLSGATRSLTKPFTLADLAATVRQALDEAALPAGQQR